MPVKRSKTKTTGKTTQKDKLFYSIGEVAKETGAKAHAIRYWEKRVPGISPMKSPGGKRLYRQKNIEKIQALKRLLEVEGMSLDNARLALESATHQSLQTEASTSEVEELRRALREVRGELEELKKELE